MKQYLAVAAFVAAVTLAVLGLFLPPMGVVDQSVNILVAQLLVLAATLLGVDSYWEQIRKMHGK